MTNKPQIELRTTPHAHAADDVVKIMRNVVYALLPITIWSVWQFGLSALALLLTVTLSCLLFERLFNQMRGEPSSLGDWSATITGLLLALTLPPGFPLWMGVVAAFAAIALGKALFGGLGMNVLNPALVGRAFVQAAFPVAIHQLDTVPVRRPFQPFCTDHPDPALPETTSAWRLGGTGTDRCLQRRHPTGSAEI